MVNRDKDFVFHKERRKVLEKSRLKVSPKDLQLEQDFIHEVNEKGYFIEYLEQINKMDKNDKILLPILYKYALLFDDGIHYSKIISALGEPCFKEAAGFLIDEFKKPNIQLLPYAMGDWNGSRRWMTSNAIYRVQNKAYIDEYIQLVENSETQPDSRLIVELLGKIKAEKAYPLLLSLLFNENIRLQGSASKAVGYFLNHLEAIPILERLISENSDMRQSDSDAKWSLKRLLAKQEKIHS